MVVILIIALFSILILAHELGHFVTARKIGAKVEEFGIGFPPRLAVAYKDPESGGWRVAFCLFRDFQRRLQRLSAVTTVYSLNLIPVGGYVKIYGEEGEARQDPKSFAAKSPGRRSLMLASGVIMNFILAAVFLSVVSVLGTPQVIEGGVGSLGQASDEKVQIITVAKDTPAFQSGLKPGDEVLAVEADNEKVVPADIAQVQDFVKKYGGQKVVLTLQRGEEEIKKEIVPRKNPPSDEGPMGVALVKTATVRYPWYFAPVRGVIQAGRLTWLFAGLLWRLITQGQMWGRIAGPVGIFNLSKQAAQLGLNYLLNFGALISINLAIINILPFPALDGGRLLFVLIEKIKGSPVSQRVEQMVHQVGFVILILLILLVTFRDIQRLL